jgi:hypothetical protein
LEAFKVLRDSVESLNIKYDDKHAQQHESNAFNAPFNEINAEFGVYEQDFNGDNWADQQTEDFLQDLNKHKRNKQENVYEFLKTEINYVKVLRIVKKIYVSGLINDCKVDAMQVEKMFPDLDMLIELHSNLLQNLIERFKQGNKKCINSVGDILADCVSLAKYN